MAETLREDCCELAPESQACAVRRPATSECESCGTRLRPVSAAHVMRQVRNPADRGIEVDYGFCPALSCRIVFVSAEGMRFSTADLRHPPAYKTEEPDDLMCYCFDFRGSDFLSERGDEATAYISERIRAGDCACHITNPSAGCCLGSIGAYRKAHTR